MPTKGEALKCRPTLIKQSYLAGASWRIPNSLQFVKSITESDVDIGNVERSSPSIILKTLVITV
jgi:hypothetical protein